MSADSRFDPLYDQYAIERQHDDPDNSLDKYPPDWNHRQAAMMNYHGEQCARCRRNIGSDPDALDFHVHHIIPLSRRGTHHLRNLVPLCIYCHGLMHPDNDQLDDWRKTPLFPAESADRRVAVERIPVNDHERALYDDRSSPADFEAEGDTNVYARSEATTSVPAEVAVQKDNLRRGEKEELDPDGEFELFCNRCGTLVPDGSPTCDSCHIEGEGLVSARTAVAGLLVLLVIIAAVALLVL